MTNVRTILVNMADGHAGNKFGLMSPDVELFAEDEKGNLIPYTPAQTASQKYLWDLEQQNIQRVIELAHGDPIKILYAGDLTQGNKRFMFLVSTRMADQVLIAIANLRPWLNIPNVIGFRLAVGTGAHNFEEASAEVLVRENLRALYPQKDINLCYHGLVEIDGVSVDYAHQGPYPGSRDWLKGNVARFYLRDLMYQEIEDGNKPPDLVVRAHYHEYLWEVLKKKKNKSQLVVLPSMCLIDDYTMQATRSKHRVTNGIVPFEIIDEILSEPIESCMETMDIRRKETL